MSISSLVSVFIPALVSCSILENRGKCLCLLDIIVPDNVSGQLSCFVWDGDSVIFSETETSLPSVNQAMRFGVEKGINTLCTVITSSGGDINAYRLHIPPGHQMDSVYASSRLVDCKVDYISDTLLLHKEFATLRMYVDGIPADATAVYYLKVSSDVCGLSFPQLSPEKGEFAYSCALAPGCPVCCRLPRQKGDMLEVALMLEGSDVPVRRYGLGGMMADAGYDWTLDDLADVEMLIDFAGADISASVEDWEEVTINVD